MHYNPVFTPSLPPSLSKPYFFIRQNYNNVNVKGSHSLLLCLNQVVTTYCKVVQGFTGPLYPQSNAHHC